MDEESEKAVCCGCGRTQETRQGEGMTEAMTYTDESRKQEGKEANRENRKYTKSKDEYDEWYGD